MIIYGSKAVHLRSVRSKSLTCPNCGTQGSTIISVFRKHAHIYWIPLFPIGKKGVSQCQHCKIAYESKDMPHPIKKEYEKIKNNSKGPIWQYAGLAIFAFLIVWAVYANGANKKLELKYINSPQVGDVYEYKIENEKYSTLKVVKVTNDSVFVAPNKYGINKMSKIDRIEKPGNYSDVTYGISISRLKEMYDSEEIFDVDR